MKEADYRRVTYDITLAAARVLARLNPAMTFIYVSGLGTDSSERGAHDVGAGEGQDGERFARAAFQGGLHVPAGRDCAGAGVKSKTRFYQAFLTVFGPLMPLLYRLFPQCVTTTEQIGRAMLKAVKQGAPNAILETVDINKL